MKLSPFFLVLAVAPLSAQNTGLQLDHGVDEHVDVPYDPLLIPQSGLTVEAWIRYDESAVTTGSYHWPTVLRQNPAPGQETYFLRVGAAASANRFLDFKIATASGGSTASYSFAPGELSTWTHVAGTYDGTMVRLFVNGVEAATAPGNGQPLVDNGGPLRIGNGDLTVAGAETWAGEIDEVRVWPFARSAAEILQTRDDMLAGLPGGVVSFNLDGHYVDTSSGLQGTPAGTPTFAVTTPLVPWGSSAGSYGSSTGNCEQLRSAIGSKPVVPFADFTARCVRAPKSSAGFFLVGLTGYATPFRVLGVDVFVDLASVVVAAPIQSDGLGAARVKVGIDDDPMLIGTTVFTQFMFLDPVCGPEGFVSSDALSVTIL